MCAMVGSPPVISAPAKSPVIPESLVREILKTAMSYFGYGVPLPAEALRSLIQEAVRVSDENYGVQAAIAWAEGYEFPQEMLDSDLRCFRAAQLDFKTMVRRRLQLLSKDRLNKERVAALSPDNPERLLMFDLAEGMRVPRPEGFVPNGKEVGGALRETYVKVHTAVNRLLGDVVQQRLAFILPKPMAVAYIDNLHLASAHWTPKKGKPSGRPIGDMTYVTGTPLNTPEATAAAEETYGPIKHPTIEDIAGMVLKFWEKTKKSNPAAKWEDLRLWKMDLKGAYTLLSFRPEDAGLFGMELSGDLVYLQIVGIFGWSCTPAAFQVVTRALKWELSKALQSLIDMYCDDMLGICLVQDLMNDLRLARAICVSLLGPAAVADDKTESGTRVEVIGYIIDLATQRVSISRKNFLNTVYGFLTTDLEAPMTIRVAQRLASWSSRYGKICRAMRPFCGALHRLTAGRTSPLATFPVTEEAKTAIRLWRSMLFLVRYDENRFTRPLASFSTEPANFIIEFDASLKGAGVLWFERRHGAEVCMGGSAIDLRFLDFGEDSSFQNLCEFMGAILGFIGLVRMGVTNADVQLRGDSVSALTWAQTERYRGTIVTNAALVFTMLAVAYGLDVKSTTHIPGDQNTRCDELSRLWESGEEIRGVLGRHNLVGANILDLNCDPNVQQLLRLCSPRLSFESEDAYLCHWGLIRDAIRGMAHPPSQYHHQY